MIPINKTNFALAPLPADDSGENGTERLTLIVKGACTLNPDGSTTPWPQAEQPEFQGDLRYGDDGGNSLYYATDVEDWKPKVDVILRAACHPPEGEPVERCDVHLEMPGRVKTLRVFGDRFWQQDPEGIWRMSAPQPFTGIPIRWERSFGGMLNAANPLGKGEDMDPMSDPEDPVYPLPNVEDPANPIRMPEDAPVPVSFAPVPEFYETRERKQGTRDLRWATFFAPRPPKDFDPHFYNAAPDDQQLERLRGYESFVVRNMHPTEPRFEIGLPDLRPRAFYVLADDKTQTLNEVPLTLDTVHIDLIENTVTVLWRGGFDHDFDEITESIDFVYLAEEVASERYRDIQWHQNNFAEDAAIYQEALEAIKTTAEDVEVREFGPILKQIVKVLGEVGASTALVDKVSAAPDMESLSDTLQAAMSEQEAQVHALSEEIKVKYNVEPDVEGSGSAS